MENLRYSNPDATDEDCIAAAKLANADGFIRMLPQGYNIPCKTPMSLWFSTTDALLSAVITMT